MEKNNGNHNFFQERKQILMIYLVPGEIIKQIQSESIFWK